MSQKVGLQFSSKKVLSQSYEDLGCWGAIRSCSELRRGMVEWLVPLGYCE